MAHGLVHAHTHTRTHARPPAPLPPCWRYWWNLLTHLHRHSEEAEHYHDGPSKAETRRSLLMGIHFKPPKQLQCNKRDGGWTHFDRNRDSDLNSLTSFRNTKQTHVPVPGTPLQINTLPTAEQEPPGRESKHTNAVATTSCTDARTKSSRTF